LVGQVADAQQALIPIGVPGPGARTVADDDPIQYRFDSVIRRGRQWLLNLKIARTSAGAPD